MIIKAYIKLQDCTSSDCQAFIAAVAQPSASRKALSIFTLWRGTVGRIYAATSMRAKVCTPETVCPFSADIGEAQGKLHKLSMEEIAQVALRPSTLRFAI